MKKLRLPIQKYLSPRFADRKQTTPVYLFFIAFLMLLFLHQTAYGSDESNQTIAKYDGIGRELSATEIENLQSQVFSDGKGLPKGSGNVQAGSKLYQQYCGSCHGTRGEGASSVELIGDRESLATVYPDKGIAVYWPYAPTLFGYIQRAMPPDKPNSFTPNELYSIVAYVLHLNGLLSDSASIDQTSLATIQLPNQKGFTDVYP